LEVDVSAKLSTGIVEHERVRRLLSRDYFSVDGTAERTIDDLWTRIGVILEQTSPQECRNFIRHDGYG